MALTGKQLAFAEEYLKCWNKTEAARRAGYNGNDVSLGSIGYENFKKPQIQEYIQQRVAETAMTADEVLKRLASHARGSMADFVRITPAGPQFDFEAASLADQLHLIKKLKTKTRTVISLGKPKKTKEAAEDEEQDEEEAADDDRLITEVDIEFELYDAQAALEKIGRHHKLFTDKLEVDAEIEIKDADTITDRLVSRIDSLAARIGAAADSSGDSAE